MDRDVHDIFDVILKIIVATYQSLFLKYMGVDEEIEEILSIEFTKLDGSKLFLDFLCLLKNGTLCHIEFQFPYAKSDDNYRFFDYNITAEVRYGKRVDTYVFNFTSKRDHKSVKIGKTKEFLPIHFYLGDVDFEKYLEKINIKVKSKKQLSFDEEITLMLMPISQEFLRDVDLLKWVSEILQFEELFDESKFQFVQAVIQLEIENFLSVDEQMKIKKEVKMTPQAQSVVLQAINEVNTKVLTENSQKAKADGIKEGIKEGKADGIKEIVKSLRDDVDLELLSKKSGLTIDEIKSL